MILLFLIKLRIVKNISRHLINFLKDVGGGDDPIKNKDYWKKLVEFNRTFEKVSENENTINSTMVISFMSDIHVYKLRTSWSDELIIDKMVESWGNS